MIYICPDCKEEIKGLRTTGETICEDLICSECSLKLQKQIAKQYVTLRDYINTLFHARQ